MAAGEALIAVIFHKMTESLCVYVKAVVTKAGEEEEEEEEDGGPLGVSVRRTPGPSPRRPRSLASLASNALLLTAAAPLGAAPGCAHSRSSP